MLGVIDGKLTGRRHQALVFHDVLEFAGFIVDDDQLLFQILFPVFVG